MANFEAFANDFETALTASIDASQTTISVASSLPSGVTGNVRIRIDNEYLLVVGGQQTLTWTVQRGIEGSTAATHASSAAVVQVMTAGGIKAAAEEHLTYLYF